MRNLLLALTLVLAPPAWAAQSVGPPAAAVTITIATSFPGAVWAVPAARGRYPVLIVLGGSEGGSSTARDMAPRFAALGYATLGLPYYNPGWDPKDATPGLPSAFVDIPVDRLSQVRRWIAAQPQADARRIGIWGASKGAEFALIAATRYPWIKAVAAIVPTDVVWEGWGTDGPPRASFAWDGKGLPFQPYSGMTAELAKTAKGEMMDLRKVHDAGRRNFPDRLAAARIPVEHYRGALLVAGGDLDRIWPSSEMTRNIAAARARAGLRTVSLTFPDAGHAIAGAPGKTNPNWTALGGTAEGVKAARAKTWAATLALFEQALRPVRRP